MRRGIVRAWRIAATASLVVVATWNRAPRAFARSAGIAQKVAPVLCGTLAVQVGAGFATGPGDAEGCFYRAFLTCTPALFTVAINPVGAGGRHTLTTGIADSGCVIVDQLAPTVDSAPTDGSSTVVCTDLTLTEGGLSESSCSGGPPLAPIPLSIRQASPQAP